MQLLSILPFDQTEGSSRPVAPKDPIAPKVGDMDLGAVECK